MILYIAKTVIVAVHNVVVVVFLFFQHFIVMINGDAKDRRQTNRQTGQTKSITPQVKSM